MSMRNQLVAYTQNLLTITPAFLETRYRLLPSLRGRLIWMVRSGLATVTASFILLQKNNPIPGGTSLIPIGAMLCLMNNFGSTNIQAYQALTGGAIGAAYSIAIAAIFAPLYSSSSGNPGSNGTLLAVVLVFMFVFVFLITLTNTSVVFKRVSMSLTIVGLLLLYQDSRIQGVILNLNSWAGIAIGVAIAIGCTILPLPIIDNATREMAIRLRINMVSLQSRLGGLVIAFTHKTESYRYLSPQESIPKPSFVQRRKRSNSILDDELELIQETVELEGYEEDKLTSGPNKINPPLPMNVPVTPFIPLDSNVSPVTSTTSSSSSSSSLPEPNIPIMFWFTTERAPLLRADIMDLQDNGNHSLPELSRLLTDMQWELIYYLPYFYALFRRLVTYFLSFLHCWTGKETEPSPVSPSKGFFYRASVWTKALARFHRVIGVMIIAEFALRSSPFHSRFIDTMGEELCECILILTSYMTLAIEQSTSFSIYRTVPKDSLLFRYPFFSPVRWIIYAYLYLWGLPVQSWKLNPDRSTDEHGSDEEDFQYPSPQLLSMKRNQLKQSVEKVFRAYQNGRLQLYENLKQSTLLLNTFVPQQPVTTRGKLHHHIDWHSEDLLALNAFVFTILRCCQIILTAAEETCFHNPSASSTRPVTVDPTVRNNHSSPSPPTISPPPNTNFMSGGEDWKLLVPPTRPPEKAKHLFRPSVQFLRRPRNIQQLYNRFRLFTVIVRYFFAVSYFDIIRATKVGAGVTLAAGLAVALQNIFGANVYYWAPITAAFLVGSADGGAWRTSALRLQGTVAGAIYGYLVILIANQNEPVLIILLTIWIMLMTYPRAQPQRSYWSLVSSLTAFVIVLGLGPDTATVDTIALGRVKQTILGILSYLFISNIFFPISARTICKQRLIYALHETRKGTRLTIEQFIRVVESQANYYTESINRNRTHRRRKSLLKKHNPSEFPSNHHSDETSVVFTMEAPLNTTAKLPDVDETLTSLMSDLLDEAAIEPALWRPQFIKSRYAQMIHSIRRTLRGISIIQQCTMSLFSEAEEQQYLAQKLHQQWPMMLSQRKLSMMIPSEVREHSKQRNLPYQLEGLPPTAFLYESRAKMPQLVVKNATLPTTSDENNIIHMHITGKAMREYTPVLPYLVNLIKSLDETFRLVLIIMNYGSTETSILSLIPSSTNKTPSVVQGASLSSSYPSSTTIVVSSTEKPSIKIPLSIIETKFEPAEFRGKTREEITSEAVINQSFTVGSTETTITDAIEITERLPTDSSEIERKLSHRIITTTTTEPTGTIMLPFLPGSVRTVPYRIAKSIGNGVRNIFILFESHCLRRLRRSTIPSISIPRTQPATVPEPTTTKYISPIEQFHIDALNQLPETVELLLQNLVEYKQAYDTLLHNAVSNVPVRETTGSLSSAAATETTTAFPIPSSSSVGTSPSPWIDISPLDAICFNTASFAITEISEAVTDIARISRRIRDN